MQTSDIVRLVDRINLPLVLAASVIGISLGAAPLLFAIYDRLEIADLVAPAYAQSQSTAVPSMQEPVTPTLDGMIDARETVDIWSCRKGC